MSYKELAKIERGKYAKRLDFLRLPTTKTSPEEIYLLLDPTKVESVAEAQLSRWAHILESYRNGLILLPLLITWLSLGLAALAYMQTYPAHPDLPFLKQWADGFPDTSLPFQVPSFVTVAGLDAGLIFILFLLTVAAQIMEGRARKQAAEIRSWLEDELYGLASTSSVRALGVGTDNKRPAWAVEVHSAIGHLNNALIGVESLVKSSHSTLTNLVNTSQTTFENLIKVSQEKLEGSVLQFSGALRDQRAAVEQFMDGTIEVRRAVDEMKKIYADGENIYLGLNQTLPKIEGAFTTMASSQGKAAIALESMSSKTDQATRAVGDIAQQFTQVDLVQSTYVAAQRMQQTAQVMQNVAVQMGNTVNQQIQLQIHMEQLAGRMAAPSVSPPPQNKGWFAPLRRWFSRSPKTPSHLKVR